MRLLISAVPVAGHLLPLLPMAHAARDAGDDVVVLTSQDLATYVDPIPYVVAGPSIWEQRAQTVRRLGRDWTGPGPEAAEMFAGTRVSTTYEPALELAGEFGPDLVVCDPLDFVAPMIAERLGVPWAAHGISGGLPGFFHDALAERWAQELSRHQLRGTDRVAFIDPYPELLDADSLEPDRLPVRQTPYSRPGGHRPVETSDPRRPTALVTLGTTVADPNAADQMATSLAGADLNVIVTSESTQPTSDARIQHVGFTPLADLLPAADVVVSAGGTGTVLSALAAGLPLVIRPYAADQPLNAGRVERFGASRTIADSHEAGAAARAVLGVESYRRAAERLRDQIRSYPSPAEVLDSLFQRMAA